MLLLQKKFLKINLARVHADKSEVRGTTDKAVVIPRAVNAGVECFSGSWIDDKRRIEVRAVCLSDTPARTYLLSLLNM